jgi:hypothetical protein
MAQSVMSDDKRTAEMSVRTNDEQIVAAMVGIVANGRRALQKQTKINEKIALKYSRHALIALGTRLLRYGYTDVT